ncbi:hypothetical protein [Falsiporphyromonas endometrii]|uniref:Lipoprotein n=1 Tax=Falsiporphyromonas endometrii TaxID=1387297 RepID=A0ABV9K882_9PORP
MIRKNILKLILFGFIIALPLASCKDDFDRISSSQADQPSFSQDTVKLDTLFSDVTSSTRQLMIYNRNKKSIRLDRVYLSDPKSGFRVNVDGHAGHEFRDLTILPGDSMYVFVEANFRRDDKALLIEEVKDKLMFECRGQSSSVLLQGYRCNADVVSEIHISKDSVLNSPLPLLVKDSIVIDKGATLTIGAGSRICFFAKSYVKVNGSLKTQGTVEKPVVLEGLRQDMMLSDLPYPLVSGQWGGIRFGETSLDNRLEYTIIKNAVNGLYFMGERSPQDPLLYMLGCQITNMKGYGIYAVGGHIALDNSEVSNTYNSTLQLQGSSFVSRACTFVNFYLFDSRFSPTLNYYDSYKVGNGERSHVQGSAFRMTNCIVDGTKSINVPKESKDSKGVLAGEMYLIMADSSLFDEIVHVDHSYLRMPQNNLIPSAMKDCLLSQDTINMKKYRYYYSLGYKEDKGKDVLSFVFDFRPLQSVAPFMNMGVAIPELSNDRYGVARNNPPTPGCYTPVASPTPTKALYYYKRRR